MPINSQFKLAFIHIPKCGGTSIEKFLGMGSRKQFFSYRPIKELALSINESVFTQEELIDLKERRPQHLTAVQLKKILSEEVYTSYNSFALVRNPYQRLLSEYCYIHEVPTEKTAEFRDTSFAEFIENTTTLNSYDRLTKFDGHLDTQASYIYDLKGNCIVNTVYRLEEIDRCEKELKAITGITASMPHSRASTLFDAQKEIPKEVKDKIYKYYEEDFRLLGYEK